MQAVVTAHQAFSASHMIPNHSTCGHLHGHDWDIAVSLTGEISPKTGMVTDHGLLVMALQDLCREFDRRDLNAMLPGVLPSPEGLAPYIRERLAMQFPTITTVTVSCGLYAAQVQWSLR